MISVIVPVYNAEKYLKKCLDSLVNQSYKDLEIILVNDGSQDGSEKICKDYEEKDSRIILINKNNGGPSSARNSGIEKANGEYLSFIDSDDYLALDFYEKLEDIEIDVFVSHIPPVDPPFSNYPNNACYVAPVPFLVGKHWVCGHQHTKGEFRILDTYFHMNPLGYPMERNELKLKTFRI